MKKKMSSLLLLCIASLSMFLTSCQKDVFSYIQGTWEVREVSVKTTIQGLPVWNAGDRMTFNSEGTGVMTVNGVSYNIVYRVQQNTLTVNYSYIDLLDGGTIKTATTMFLVSNIDSSNMTLDHSDGDGTSHFVLVKAN